MRPAAVVGRHSVMVVAVAVAVFWPATGLLIAAWAQAAEAVTCCAVAQRVAASVLHPA